MEEKAAARIINDWGAIGAVLILGLILSTSVIWILYKALEKRNRQQREDFEEMRRIARGEILDAAEASRVAINNNSKHLEENRKLIDEIRLVLIKLLEQKL